MTFSLIAFTECGSHTMGQIADFLCNQGHCILETCCLHGSLKQGISLNDWTKNAFQRSNAIVFIGACGIAIRAIAPFLRDKLSDPAVLSIDDQGKFVIPLVSGHVGGANELAKVIAKATDGTPVISTATDIHNKFAVDVWAKNHGIRLCERQIAKEISSALLDNKTVGLQSDFTIDSDLPNGLVPCNSGHLGISITLDSTNQPFEHTLHAVPQIVTIGVGCRKHVASETFEQAILNTLKQNRVAIESVACLASIDLKAGEPCIHSFCNAFHLPFVTASAETLSTVDGTFTSSEFVERITGVDNVCERAAVLVGGGALLFRKQCKNGVTIAASVPEWCVKFKNPTNLRG